jgi:succinate dehydrogenase / fumarate reductase flavoprotein subunit
MLAPFEMTQGESPYQLHRELQDTMQNHVGIFRTEEDLKRGLDELELLNARAARLKVDGSRLFNPGWHLARDLQSMLTVSQAVALSAQARKESRGAHSRIDYPNYDETWAKQHNIVVREGDRMTLKQLPVMEMPGELKELV